MEIVKKKKKLHKYIKSTKQIFIMAHKNLDLDALGSSIGMYMILKRQKKECFLIIDDKEHELGVSKILKELEGCLTIITSKQVNNYLNPKENKNLLLTIRAMILNNEGMLWITYQNFRGLIVISNF